MTYWKDSSEKSDANSSFACFTIQEASSLKYISATVNWKTIKFILKVSVRYLNEIWLRSFTTAIYFVSVIKIGGNIHQAIWISVPMLFHVEVQQPFTFSLRWSIILKQFFSSWPTASWFKISLNLRFTCRSTIVGKFSSSFIIITDVLEIDVLQLWARLSVTRKC